MPAQHPPEDPLFIPGMELSRRFYHEVVRPVLDRRFPGLAHSAARLDGGSEVLGFDTPLSRDHGWGPAVTLFVSEADAEIAAEVERVMEAEIPAAFLGHPTRFTRHAPGREPVEAHGVALETVGGFFRGYVGFDPRLPAAPADWLAAPAHRLRTVASGSVFHDGLGGLEPARRALAWYPRDLWLYVLACQWGRVAQEESFMARAGDVGDELGSRWVAGRQVTELLRLCFLLERVYPPYAKWLGSAFARLACAPRMAPLLEAVFDARGWRERERRLSAAYLLAGELHDAAGLTPPVEPRIAPFHGRPYAVPHAGRYAGALMAEVRDPGVRALPPGLGAVWQFTDATEVAYHVERSRLLRVVYGDPG